MSEMTNKPKVNVKAQKYAENWLPIRGIQNGEIILETGERVTGVKIKPKNIFILDYDSQNNAIFNLRNFYNTIDFEFWLIIADRPVDINVYLAQLQLLYQKSQSSVVRKLIMQDINKANDFMSQQYGVVDTEYYILFKEKNMEIIQKRIRTLMGNLANAGLNSTQVSNNDLRMV